MTPDEILAQVAQEVTSCQQCPLYHTRKKAVPGEGPLDAQILFIGEGPGFNENEQGRPFVGAAGQFLEELLGKAGLKRKDVFITNVVKCRPPGNRDPEPDEIKTCTTRYLQRQIEAINPKVIVTLGRFSMGLFLTNARISGVHGRPVRIDGRLIVPMFHPAAALHQPALRDSILADFAKLSSFLSPAPAGAEKKAVTSTAPAAIPAQPEEKKEDDKPVQLSLF
jgi:uracil-DNA glycosylase